MRKGKYWIKRGALLSFLMAAAMLLGSACSNEETLTEKIEQENLTVVVNEYFNEREKTQAEDVTTVDVLAVGDNLIHSGLYKSE